MRPYKALFGGATNDPSVRHSLDLSVSVAEGYDDNVLAQGGRPRRWYRHGFANEWSLHEYRPGAHICLDWEDRAVQRVRVHEHSLLPEGARVSRVNIVWSDRVSAGSERTRFSFTQSVNYSPAYFYGLFPSFMPPMSWTP